MSLYACHSVFDFGLLQQWTFTNSKKEEETTKTQEKISMLSTMGIVSTDDILKYFPLKAGLDILCKLLTVETICMKCQILFSGKK